MRSLFNRWCIPILLALLLLSVMAFSAAGQPEPAHARTDTFVIGDISPPYNMDPAQTSAMIDLRLLRGMYETLVILGDDGITAEPGAAESWEVSDDGLTYTFHLREDARWSDGSPVTAEDFVAGWFRTLLPDTHGDYAGLHHVIAGATEFVDWRVQQIEALWERGGPISRDESQLGFFSSYDRYRDTVGVDTVGDHTLRVTLTKPTPFFPAIVMMPCFAPTPGAYLDPDEFWHSDGLTRVDPALLTDPRRMVCNGPYVLERFEVDGDVVLTANEHHWGAENVKTPRIHLRILEEEALISAYERGDVDWVPSLYWGDTGKMMLHTGRDDVHLIRNAGTYYYEFNCRPEVNGEPNPFADRTLRRTFAHAMDRESICDLIGMATTPQGTFIPAEIIAGYDAPTDAVIPYDLGRAAELLEEAGFPNGDGLLGFDLLTNGSSPNGGVNVEIAEFLREQWSEQLGASAVNLREPEFRVYLEESQLGNFHIRRAGWFGDYHDPTTFLDLFRRDSPSNHSGYYSDAFNALMDAADVELDVDARLALLREAEALLLQDAVVVPLYRYGTVSLYDPERVRVPLNAWNYIRLDHLEHLESE